MRVALPFWLSRIAMGIKRNGHATIWLKSLELGRVCQKWCHRRLCLTQSQTKAAVTVADFISKMKAVGHYYYNMDNRTVSDKPDQRVRTLSQAF